MSDLSFSFQTILRGAALTSCIAALAACGGGGGGGGSSSAPKTPYPIATPYSHFITNGSASSVSITGKIQDMSVTGSGSIAFSPAVAATFEGTNGVSTTESVNASVVVDNTPITIPTITTTTYYDSNYREIGGLFVGNTYGVVNVSHSLPVEASVGDSGELYAYTMYSGPSKISVVGSATSGYTVESGDANSVILRISISFYDTGHSLSEVDDYRYRIDANGNITFVSLNTDADGDKLKFTAN
jgi:hypothetical protein